MGLEEVYKRIEEEYPEEKQYHKKVLDLMNRMTEEEREKGAEERWDSVAAEPLQNHPIPKDLLEKWKEESRI